MEKKNVRPAQVAEVKLVYQSRVKPADRPQVTGSATAYQILKGLWNPGTLELLEEFKVLYLNQANRVLCLYPASSGGITGTVADPRLIFTVALRVHAVALILAHNHPSGSLTPSRADEELTGKMKAAGSLLEIKVLDHLILSCDGYYSFADEGLL